jgi:hypothetical protein
MTERYTQQLIQKEEPMNFYLTSIPLGNVNSVKGKAQYGRKESGPKMNIYKINIMVMSQTQRNIRYWPEKI